MKSSLIWLDTFAISAISRRRRAGSLGASAKEAKRIVIFPCNFHISQRDKCRAFGRNDSPTNKLRAFLSGPMKARANASEASR